MDIVEKELRQMAEVRRVQYARRGSTCESCGDWFAPGTLGDQEIEQYDGVCGVCVAIQEEDDCANNEEGEWELF